MGIIADTVNEAQYNSKGEGILTDLRSAQQVEVLADGANKFWVNVDGITVLRIGSVEELLVDTSARSQNGTTLRASEPEGE